MKIIIKKKERERERRRRRRGFESQLVCGRLKNEKVRKEAEQKERWRQLT